jgi:phage anti-repressor protein
MNNELSRKEFLTELANGVKFDEENRISSKELYSFLGLSTQNYARWCERNITNNEALEEGIDYKAVVYTTLPSEELTKTGLKPNFGQEFMLNADIAEELAMEAHTKNGRMVRDYLRKILTVSIKQYNELTVLLKEEIEQRKTLEKRLDNVISDLSELRLESNRVSDFTKRNEPYFKKIMDHYLKSPSSVVRSCADKDFITDAVIRLMEEMDAKFKYDWAVNEYRSMYQRDIPKHKYSMIDCLPEYQLLFTLALAKLVEKLGD